MFPKLKEIFSAASFGYRSRIAPKKGVLPLIARQMSVPIPASATVGLIAGNGSFPLTFAGEARARGHRIIAVCHRDETSPELASLVDAVKWIRVGELGSIIDTFKAESVSHVAMAGGIARIKHFGDVKLDARGLKLILRVRSKKDDVIMRGIAEELENEGMQVIPCTTFLTDCITRQGVLTRRAPSDEEWEDIQVGIDALKAISSQDIGQLVVVQKGVIVAVEAVEGSNAAILRGGQLGGSGTVVVKYAKTTQDMRFDVPTVGLKTIEVMEQSGARVLALEAGRSVIMDEQETVAKAESLGISIVGHLPLVTEDPS